MADNEFSFDNVYDVVKSYESGFVGAVCDPVATEKLQADIAAAGGLPQGAMACSAYGLEDSGKGKLSLPFLEILKLYPDSLPGGAQGRGDCVSWSTRNAGLTTMCCDITSGTPDEASGRLEGAPEISDTARLAGVLSTEAIYNWRRHGGDGRGSEHLTPRGQHTLLDARGFGPDDFARSHPGGALGRRLLTHVADIMRTGDEIPCVPDSASFADAVLEISRKRMGMTAVVDAQQRLVGIFTDGDLRRSLEQGADMRQARVSDVMTRNPRSIRPQALAVEAAQLMEQFKTTQLPVVDEHGLLTGALNVHDLFRAKVI
jgi:CBS domain-containing protein